MKALDKLLTTPDEQIPDDDHPNRTPVLTDKETDDALDQLKKKYFNSDGSRKKKRKKK